MTEPTHGVVVTPKGHVFHVHAKTADHAGTGFNGRLAVWMLTHVGTMYCFYLFNVIALLSAKSAFQTHNLVPIVNWISSNWIQLILLPALLVGQNLQAAAADARAAKTFEDTEAAKEGIVTALDLLDTKTEGGLADVLKAIQALTPPPEAP